ncbi:MAG: nitroreductase family protein [Pseudomonadales bacterium]
MLNLTADQLLTTTRSVRKRLDFDQSVDRAIIQECLEIAFQAPNGSNMNTWRWLVVDDPELIKKISELYNQGTEDFIATMGDAVGDNYAGASIPGFSGINESVDYLRQNMHRAPAILIPLMFGRVENSGVFWQASSYGSILQATWSFFLALRERGLGSAWTTAHLWREKEIADLLGIPFDQYTQVGLFPIAHTIGHDFKKAYRKSFDEVANWNQFE